MPRAVRHFLVAVLAMALGASRVGAGVGAWTSSGPPGIVEALAISPNPDGRAYAITNSGLYQSPDAGQTWFAVGAPPPLQSLQELALDPFFPDLLYAAGDGVLRTTLGGFQWVSGSGLPPGFLATRVATDNYGVVLVSGPDLGMYWSGEFGMSWLRITTPFSRPLAIAVDASATGRFYAGTESGEVFRSNDSGRSWSPVGTGLPGAPVLELTASYRTNPDLYATVAGGGVFRNRSSSGTWSAAGTGLPSSEGIRVCADPQSSNVLYAATGGGVYRSVDSGDSWAPFSDGIPQGLGVRQVMTNSTGRSLIAIPASGPGTLLYRLPNPALRGAGPASPVVANTPVSVTLRIDPPQPEGLRIGFSFSDPSVFTAFSDAVGTTPLQETVSVPVRAVGGGKANVKATLPELVGGANVTIEVDVVNPAPPNISFVYPPNATGQTSAFLLSVHTSKADDPQFVTGTAVYWNGSPRKTELKGICTVGCVTWLEAEILESDVHGGGTATLTLVNPGPGGGVSAPFAFLVRSPDRSPIVARPGPRPGTRVKPPRG